jgi:BASS family bile acid:Na+ symporter
LIDEIVTLGSILSFIGKHGTWILPSGFVVGLLSPSLTVLARPLAEPLVLLMFAISIYRLDPVVIRERIRHSRIVAIGVVWVLLAVPVIVFAVGWLLDLPSGLLVVLVAWSACPPLVTVPGLALLLGLDGAAALLIMLGSTILFPITLPLVLMAFVGDGFGAVPALSIAGRLLLMVVGCFVVGQGARLLLGARRAEKSGPAVDGVLVILLAVFAVTIMGGLHRAVETNPERIPIFLATAFFASAALQLITAGVFFRLPKSFSGATALASGNRNFALLLPVVGAGAAEDMWLYLGVVQFPIYILPILSKPLFRWYMKGDGDRETKERDKIP